MIEAKIIWRARKITGLCKYENLRKDNTYADDVIKTFAVIHRPYTEYETLVQHTEDGKCYAHFSVGEPPSFDVPHPACLTGVEIL